MKILVEFMNHAGRVPYFIGRRFPWITANLMIGETLNVDECYVPDTLVVLTRQDVIDRAVAAVIYKPYLPGETPVEYTAAEKEALAIEWLDGDN